MPEPTNAEWANADRAERAERAVKEYAGNEYGFGTKDFRAAEWVRALTPDYETAIQDLITDLLHLREREGTEDPRDTLRKMLDRAVSNYRAEVKEAK